MSKVIFVTGAGRGLGTDIARQALAAGHQVVATGRRPANVLDALGGEQETSWSPPWTSPVPTPPKRPSTPP